MTPDERSAYALGDCDSFTSFPSARFEPLGLPMYLARVIAAPIANRRPDKRSHAVANSMRVLLPSERTVLLQRTHTVISGTYALPSAVSMDDNLPVMRGDRSFR